MSLEDTVTDQRPLSLNLGKTQFSAGDRASVFKLPIMP